MHKIFRYMLLGWLAAAVAGCDDGGDDDGGAGGAPGGAGAPGVGGASGGTGAGTQVTWTATGWVDKAMNGFGMVGSWYAYDDCKDAGTLPCTMRDASLTGPDSPSTPGWTVKGEGAASQVCAKGTAPKVMDSASYGKQWGFGIALDFANPGMGAVKAKYNANGTTPPIKGFSFNVTGTAPAKIRINVPTADPDNATYFREISIPSTPDKATVLFADATNFHQGSWVKTQTPELVKTFDPTSIYGVQFQVFTELAKETPFDFCVSDFRVLQ